MKKVLAMTLALTLAFGTVALPAVEGGITFDTGISASAEETSNVFEYEINDDETVTITGYNGNGGNVTIPATINGMNVTGIRDSAFEDCSGLTSVTIPDTVTSIGDSAFRGCSNLTSITVDSNNKNYSSRDGVLFNKNKTELIQYPIGNTRKSYTIPNSVTSIGDSAFYDCSSLTSVTIPDSVTCIEVYAFYDCSSLTSITIPDSVTSIGDSAFGGCSGLTSITIPDSVTSIGDSAFGGCSGLTSITIPDSVTSIGDYAFQWCSSLASVTIPDSVTSIGDYAFQLCSSLASVTIPDGVTSIGAYAFYYCPDLTSITIPDSVTSIGDDAFSSCSSLTSITVDSNNKNYSSRDGVLFNKNKTELIQYPIGNTRKSYTISNSVTSIGDSAFYDCSSLTSVTIPDSVTSIGHYAFTYCLNLTSITIPDSVTYIGEYTFLDCSGLTSITIPNSVKSIGNYAFWGCSSLTSITIPDSVTDIGECTFLDCSGLTSITIPNSVNSIGKNAFYNTPWFKAKQKNNPFVIVNGILIDGSTATGNVVIPNTVKIINDFAFQGMYNEETYKYDTNIKSITIPDSVTSIGDYAFISCINLTGIKIPNSVKSIGYSAFYGCESLTSITIPDSVTSISDITFYNCSKLTSITIPDSVTSIGDSAFSFCSSLKDVYYTGTKEKWNKISIDVDNDNLKNATIHYNDVPQHTHKFGKWTVTKKPTCTTNGEQQRKCSCGKIEMQTINALGHNLVKIKVVKPTLKSKGYTLYKCSVCGATIKKDYVPALVSITKAKITGIKDTTYTGKQIKPSIKVVIGKTTLKNGRDYTVSYGKNKTVGKGTVTIIGKGKYAGKITKTFKILPAKTFAKLSTTKGKIKVTLKKSKGAKKYQIQYATNKKFKSAKIITTTATKKTLKAKSKKVYYVRVRSVNGKYVSGWSAVKKIKVK